MKRKKRKLLSLVLCLSVFLNMYPFNTVFAAPADELVKVIVNYQFEDGTEAYESNISTLKYGDDYITTIKNPKLPGYMAYTKDENGTYNEAENLLISLKDITADVVYTVYYMPIDVQYSVRYFLQNANNDLYTEDASLYRIGYGKTGTNPDTLDIDIEGFTKLFQDPAVIAADGSTEFELYYDRLYFLLNFDLDGGFGVDPIYARYGTTIVVNTPEKPGYVFQGWQLVDEKGNVANEVSEIPSTMPAKNMKYKAKWGSSSTKYTVVYWLENADDSSYSYIASKRFDAVSGTKASGQDNLASAYSCGLDEHTHSEAEKCYSCSNMHTCSISCYASSYSLASSQTGTVATVFSNLTSKVGTPVERTVYKYAYRPSYSTTYYNFFYYGGTWYYLGTGSTYGGVSLNGTLSNPSRNSFNSVLAKECSGGGHTHNASCLVCKKDNHSHDSSCSVDMTYFQFVRADQNVIVEGDESTVINVYYTRKQYTLKFYYAKEEDGKFYVCGNTTQFANGSGITSQLGNVSGEWGQVKELPTISSTDNIDVSIYEMGYDEYTISGKTGKYYYLKFTDKYDADISHKWPVGIFNSAETSTTFDFGNYAYFSAWNVDSESWYDNQYSNKTLKGNYQRLDYKMLMTNNSEQTTINFLGFWENGKTNLGWNKPHKWNYNVYVPVLDGATSYDKEYNGVKYELYGTYVVYDNNTSTSTSQYCEQTPTALEGYTISHYNAYKVETYDTTYNLEIHQIDFYYTRNTNYSLKFYNYGELDDKKSQNNMQFEEKLSDYYYVPEYPSTLEKDAYTFEGWYTTKGCYEGTKVDFDTLTMPASNLLLYANWVPLTHKVYAYENIKDYNNNALYDSTETIHGHYIPTSEIENPVKIGYDFVGWFYYDSVTGAKKKFELNELPVTEELRLFGEWTSAIITSYEITYVVNIEGEEKTVSTVEKGYAFAGQTRTFTAKTGEDLYESYQAKYYPATNSHSILMDSDPRENNFTFEYLYKDKVNYTIKYINTATNTELFEDVKGTTTDTTITEKFLSKTGYLPDSVYKTLVLSANDNENILTFFYTQYLNDEVIEDLEEEVIEPEDVEQKAYYVIRHYIQMTDKNGNPYYKEYTVEQHLETLGETVTAEYISILGYEPFTKTNNDEYGPTVISGTVVEEGLELNLFYSKTSYPYMIRYMNYDTGELMDDNSVILGTSPYGSYVEGTARTFENYELVGDSTTRSIEIKVSKGNITDDIENISNVITFYYTTLEATIRYVVVPAGCGNISSSQDVLDADMLDDDNVGSTAIETKNYKFDGWYLDENCSQKVTNSSSVELSNNGYTIRPKKLEDVTYYAKFELQVSNMTITRSNVTEDDTQVFIYQIRNNSTNEIIYVSATGNDSVTLYDMPLGNYTITQMNDWSWRYGDASVTIEHQDADGEEVIFSGTAKEGWLNGHSPVKTLKRGG